MVRAETDADGNAKYEVHMVKADGTGTTVYLDESFNVVSVEDRGAGGRGGHGGQRSDETPLTGDVLAKVEAAALAEAGSGSTLLRAETDADGNAKYEAHVTKADGTHVTVYLDENYSVVSVEDGPAGGGHGHGARGAQHRFRRRPTPRPAPPRPTRTSPARPSSTPTEAPLLTLLASPGEPPRARPAHRSPVPETPGGTLVSCPAKARSC